MISVWVLTMIMYADRTTTITHYLQFDSQEACEQAKAVQDADNKERGIKSESSCSLQQMAK